MNAALLTTELRYEHDVVLARQRARRLGELFGLDQQDRTRLATAVSEIARNAFEYAGGGRVEYFLNPVNGHAELVVRVSDTGPGIADVQMVLDGRYTSRTGLGLGVVGAKRLTDRFDIASVRGQGTTVTLAKRLAGPGTAHAARIHDVAKTLAAEVAETPVAELQRQNQEILQALALVRERQSEVERLNKELEETNRGVLALYAELDERAVYLTRINELKTKFLSELSHELRTPLNAIRNVSRFLCEGYQGELNDGQRKGVMMIDSAATSLASFVDDWLDLAKIEAGRIEVHPAEFTVDSLFSALRGVFRPLAISPDVELQFEVVGGIPAIFTDEPKVSQVLRNFISNALKFTERGRIDITGKRDGEQVLFEVSDTGIGIAPEDQERIFQEFAQVEHPLQRRAKGTGLGLPLSRKLARLLGGDIALRARDEGGSTFSLRIPLDFRTVATPRSQAFAIGETLSA